MKRRAIPTAEERPTLKVAEILEPLGISETAAYEGIARGEIPSLRVGRRILIPTARLRQVLGLDHEPEATAS